MRDCTTFGLVGDGDQIDLFEEIEAILGISLDNADLEGIDTLQDLLELVEDQVGSGDGERCLLSAAFTKIRDTGAVPLPLCRPSTDLNEVLYAADTDAEISRLSEVSGLDLSIWLQFAPVAGLPAWVWFCGSALCGMSAAFVSESFWPLLVWVLFAGIINHYWPMQLPTHVRSLGDLIRQSLPNNYVKLRTVFGSGNAADRRVLVTALCRDFGCYSGLVTGQTTFFTLRSRGEN